MLFVEIIEIFVFGNFCLYHSLEVSPDVGHVPFVGRYVHTFVLYEKYVSVVGVWVSLVPYPNVDLFEKKRRLSVVFTLETYLLMVLSIY